MAKSKQRKTKFNSRKAKQVRQTVLAGANKITGAARAKVVAQLTASESHLPDRERGLYNKYQIRRTDGSSEPGGKHAGCRLFVLDIDHDQHSVPAIMAYAASARADGFERLTDDIYGMIQPEVQALNAAAQSGAVELLTDVEKATDTELKAAATEIYLDMPAGTYESQVLAELLTRFVVIVAEPRPEEPAPKAKRKYTRKVKDNEQIAQPAASATEKTEHLTGC